MAEFESVVDYSTKLKNFEGPLDLLLHLIKEAQIEIKDIFVSEVTDQFLKYMDGLSVLDVDKTSEYLNMAATLLEIKSKAILPKIDETFDEEDPEQTLIRQLEEYKLFKEASAKLKEQENVDRFYKEPDDDVGEVKVIYNKFNLQGLISAFSKLLMRVDDKRRQENTLKEIPKEVFTVKDKFLTPVYLPLLSINRHTSPIKTLISVYIGSNMRFHYIYFIIFTEICNYIML